MVKPPIWPMRLLSMVASLDQRVIEEGGRKEGLGSVCVWVVFSYGMGCGGCSLLLLLRLRKRFGAGSRREQVLYICRDPGHGGLLGCM